ncbi:hypothetical protein ABIE27_001711 [Paenibacillus sp. 4624]|jgi:hypothetical protein|uniref:Uncharacterized protein n=1 Tax=Paenibacillus amylolyticus TaxID=1451 RepID=A0A5M9WYB3_PAEAM|nr:hypothetical protein [Paenibacillus amylolyticus]KAA8786398.1 hypothetical protein EC604_21390 [Paenibacillus amylolyticus]
MIVGWGKQTNLTASRTRFIRSSRVSPNVSDNQANLVSRASHTSETSQKTKKINNGCPQIKGRSGGGITDG